MIGNVDMTSGDASTRMVEQRTGEPSRSAKRRKIDINTFASDHRPAQELEVAQHTQSPTYPPPNIGRASSGPGSGPWSAAEDIALYRLLCTQGARVLSNGWLCQRHNAAGFNRDRCSVGIRKVELLEKVYYHWSVERFEQWRSDQTTTAGTTNRPTDAGSTSDTGAGQRATESLASQKTAIAHFQSPEQAIVLGARSRGIAEPSSPTAQGVDNTPLVALRLPVDAGAATKTPAEPDPYGRRDSSGNLTTARDLVLCEDRDACDFTTPAAPAGRPSSGAERATALWEPTLRLVSDYTSSQQEDWLSLGQRARHDTLVSASEALGDRQLSLCARLRLAEDMSALCEVSGYVSVAALADYIDVVRNFRDSAVTASAAQPPTSASPPALTSPVLWDDAASPLDGPKLDEPVYARGAARSGSPPMARAASGTATAHGQPIWDAAAASTAMESFYRHAPLLDTIMGDVPAGLLGDWRHDETTDDVTSGDPPLDMAVDSPPGHLDIHPSSNARSARPGSNDNMGITSPGRRTLAPSSVTYDVLGQRGSEEPRPRNIAPTATVVEHTQLRFQSLQAPAIVNKARTANRHTNLQSSPRYPPRRAKSLSDGAGSRAYHSAATDGADPFAKNEPVDEHPLVKQEPVDEQLFTGQGPPDRTPELFNGPPSPQHNSYQVDEAPVAPVDAPRQARSKYDDVTRGPNAEDPNETEVHVHCKGCDNKIVERKPLFTLDGIFLVREKVCDECGNKRLHHLDDRQRRSVQGQRFQKMVRDMRDLLSRGLKAKNSKSKDIRRGPTPDDPYENYVLIQCNHCRAHKFDDTPQFSLQGLYIAREITCTCRTTRPTLHIPMGNRPHTTTTKLLQIRRRPDMSAPTSDARVGMHGAPEASYASSGEEDKVTSPPAEATAHSVSAKVAASTAARRAKGCKAHLKRGPLQGVAREETVRVVCVACDNEIIDPAPSFAIGDGFYLIRPMVCKNCPKIGNSATHLHRPSDGRADAKQMGKL